MNCLVIGGAESGKSAFAENLARQSHDSVIYIATMKPTLDAEMTQRLAKHRERRPAHWRVMEVAEHVSSCMRLYPNECILIDSLSMWISNLMEQKRDISAAIEELCETLEQRAKASQAATFLVSTWVGEGITPLNQVARAFIGHVGALNQRLAAQCDRVVSVQAGLPLWLKPTSHL